MGDKMKDGTMMMDEGEAVAMRWSLLLLASLLTVSLATGPAVAQALRIGAPAPEVAGERWINSGPLTTQGLRGRVVLVEFWTYG
jgi:hypothetical protein